MKPFVARAYNTFEVDHDTSVVTKFSDNSKLLKEALYYNAIPKDLKGFFANKISDSVNDGIFQLELELYDYPNLGDYFRGLDFNKKTWEKIAKRIVFILDSFKTHIHYEQEWENLDLFREAMFLDKTVHYNGEAFKNKDLKALFDKDFLKINGKQLRGFNNILGDLASFINANFYNDPPKGREPFSVIHGDFCFSNILCSSANRCLKLIDPRGHFGVDGIYGDPRYDIAKLMHSYHGGYESIINDYFQVSLNDGVNFRCAGKDKRVLVEEVFESVDNRFKDKNAKLIEGLIFIGMCSRHYDSLDRQIVMYATGIEILNEVLG